MFYRINDCISPVPTHHSDSLRMDANSSSQTEINSWAKPDWSREEPQKFWDPGRKLIKSLRDYQSLADKKGPFARIRKRFCVLRHRFWSVVTGAEIPLNCQLGGGLKIPHPNGIVIHPQASVGPNCLILQQVTLTCEAHLGCHVDVGAGAKILGPVQIGNHVQVGANAVVIRDVEDGQTVVGVPAKPVRKKVTSDP